MHKGGCFQNLLMYNFKKKFYLESVLPKVGKKNIDMLNTRIYTDGSKEIHSRKSGVFCDELGIGISRRVRFDCSICKPQFSRPGTPGPLLSLNSYKTTSLLVRQFRNVPGRLYDITLAWVPKHRDHYGYK